MKDIRSMSRFIFLHVMSNCSHIIDQKDPIYLYLLKNSFQFKLVVCPQFTFAIMHILLLLKVAYSNLQQKMCSTLGLGFW